MPNKIDELFAPERLRRNWQKAKKRTEESQSPQTDDQLPLDIFEHLQKLIQGRFSGENAVVCKLLLEELHTLLVSVFPAGEANKPLSEDQAAMIPAIHETLNRIEDILDAFEIASRNR